MKSDGLFKTLVATFIIVLVIYVAAYTGIEHHRTRQGPWLVRFAKDAAGAPVLFINQPTLAITNLQIAFPGAMPPTNIPADTVVFDRPRPVPFDLPFGQCLFVDTTFLPGTIVFDFFGHEIQLLPRVLTIDKKEQPWHSDTILSLLPLTNNAPPPAVPAH